MRNRLKHFMIYVAAAVQFALLSTSAYAEEKLPFSSKVMTGTLENGLTYYILKNDYPSDKVEFRLNVRSGSLNETEEERGIAHFVEHMAFNGTKNFPKNSVIKFMEDAGLIFGKDSNAYTYYNNTNYQLTIPAANGELIEKAFAVMRDWADGITFNEQDVIDERSVIVEEERMRSDFRQRIGRQSRQYLFAGSLYNEREPIGKTEVIKNADKALVEGYYKKWYTPSNMSVAVVGNIEPEKAKEFIEKYFSSMEKRQTPEKADTTIPFTDGIRVNVISDPEAKGLSATVTFFEKGDRPDNYEDFKEYTLQLSTAAMLNKRMSLKITEKQSNLLSFRSNVSQTNGGLRISSFYATFEDGTFDKSLAEMLSEIERTKRYGFTLTELKDFKTDRLTFLSRAADPEFNYPSEQYIDGICDFDTYGGYYTDFEQDKVLYERFFKDTNLTSFNRAFASKVSSSAVLLTVIVPEKDKDSIKIDVESFKKLLDDTAKANIVADKDESGNIKLIKEEIKPGEVKSSKQIEKIDATEVVFSNGVKLVVKKNTEEKNRFVMAGKKLGGLAVLNDEEARLVPVMVKAISSSGFKDVTRRQLSSYMSGRQAGVFLKITENTFDINGQGDTRDMEVFFRLLYKYFTAANISSDALSATIKSYENEIRNNLEDKKLQFNRDIAPKMYNENYRRLYLLEEDLKNAKASKLMEMYENAYSDPENFVFVISTDADIQEVIKLGAKYLGSLKAGGKKAFTKDRTIHIKQGVADGYGDVENRTEVNIYLDNSVKGDELTAYKMYPVRNALRIRLRETVREEIGGVYSISAILRYTDIPSSDFLGRISYTCDPARQEEILKKTFEIIDDYIKNGITAAELESAKKTQKNAFESSAKENKYWANSIASDMVFGKEILSLDEYYKIVDSYTLEETNALIVSTLKGYKSFVSSYGPEKEIKK